MTPVFNLPSFPRRRRFFDGVEGAEVEQLIANAYVGNVSTTRAGKIDTRGASLVSLFTPIPILFCGGSPPCVSRFIVPRVVYSVYAVLWAWFRANVVIKRTKGRSPRIMHRDSAPSPKRKIFPRFVIAPRYHALPSFVFGQIRKAMRSVPACSEVRYEASAASSISASKVSAACDYLVSAIALTKPPMLCFALPCIAKNAKPAVGVPSKVNKSWVCWYTDVRHIATLNSDVIRGSVVPATDSHIIPFTGVPA